MKTRVLFADRDAGVRDICRCFLEECGYEVETADNALECFNVLMAKTPSVLFLEQDLLWGGAEGIVARIREDHDVPPVPVVLIANGASAERRSISFAHPIVAALQKPVRMSDLLRAMISARQWSPEGNGKVNPSSAIMQ